MTVVEVDVRQPEVREALAEIAARALEHTPGLRTATPSGNIVWNKDVPLYTIMGYPHAGPHELAFAASAQNALVPLMNFVSELLAASQVPAVAETKSVASAATTEAYTKKPLEKKPVSRKPGVRG